MRIDNARHRLEVRKADLSGSAFEKVKRADATFRDGDLSRCSFEDANLSGCRIREAANLARPALVDVNLDRMTSDGILVNDLLAFWRNSHKAESR